MRVSTEIFDVFCDSGLRWLGEWKEKKGKAMVVWRSDIVDRGSLHIRIFCSAELCGGLADVVGGFSLEAKVIVASGLER